MTLPAVLTASLPFTTLLTYLFVATFWQGLALATVTTVALHLLPPLAPRLRYRILVAGYASCILIPLITTCANLHPAAPGVSGLAAVASSPLFTLSPLWTLLCTALWLCTSLLATMRLCAALWSIRNLRRSALPASPAQLQRFHSLLHRPGRRSVRLGITPNLQAPVAVGYRNPSILVPSQLFDTLSPQQMEQILRHELEHLARGDHWATLLAALLRCLLPLSPALFWFEHQLLSTREMACDDAVLRVTSPRAYAANLAHIAESALFPTQSIALHLVGSASQLTQRIEHILSSPPARTPSARIAQPALLAILVGTSAFLAHCPAPIAFSSIPAQAATIAASLAPPHASRPGPGLTQRLTQILAQSNAATQLASMRFSTASGPHLHHMALQHRSARLLQSAAQPVLLADLPAQSLPIVRPDSAAPASTEETTAAEAGVTTVPSSATFLILWNSAGRPVFATLVLRIDPTHHHLCDYPSPSFALPI